MRAIIDGLPEPVILLDSQRRVIVANAAAEDLFGIGLTGFNLVRAIRVPDVLSCVDRVLAGRREAETTFTLTMPVRAHYRALAVRARHDPQGRERAVVPELAVDLDTDALADVAVVLSLQDVSHVFEAEEIRSNFVANVSHELRSPLTSLSALIETLQTSARENPEKQTRFLQIMEREALRMNRLIDDLLSLSKLEANARIRPDSVVDLAQLLKEATASAQARDPDRPIELVVDTPTAHRRIPGDADELTQVFSNLLDNAMKYSPAKATVRVTVEERGQWPGINGSASIVSVQDEGDGMAREHIPRLTERFYRVDAGRSREKGGTGLGLAIVKHIVTRHRGRLQIRSQPGVGSVFAVALPRDASAR
ncbi:MAG: ATP-binding protein [Pseudomonadota bacterium]